MAMPINVSWTKLECLKLLVHNAIILTPINYKVLQLADDAKEVILLVQFGSWQRGFYKLWLSEWCDRC